MSASAQVTGLNHRGEGVGRVLSGPDEGLVVFLAGTVPGDKVEYETIERKKGFLRGRVLEIVRPGPGRIKESCPVASDCGGCTWQHLEYPLQLEWKRKIVEEAFARIAKVRDLEVLPCIPSPRILEYRNKVEVPLAVRGGSITAGFFKPYSHDVVASLDCPLEHPSAREVIREMVEMLRHRKFSVYDEKTGRGLVRHVMARAAPGTGERMAVLVINGRGLPGGASTEEEFARELREKLPRLVSVVLNFNTERTNIILGERNRVIGGRAYIEDLFGDDGLGCLRFRVSPHSFYQVNSEQAVQLYRIVLDAAGLGPDDLVYDVYSGIGTITLFAARRASRAVGIEEVPPAVKDARKNAEINGIKNVSFVEGRAERVLPSMTRSRHGDPSVVILDPPRGGAEEGALTAIARSRPRNIVYVSCNPATLARDLITLGTYGWRPTYCQPVDMFPMTPHTECACLLERA